MFPGGCGQCQLRIRGILMSRRGLVPGSWPLSLSCLIRFHDLEQSHCRYTTACKISLYTKLSTWLSPKRRALDQPFTHSHVCLCAREPPRDLSSTAKISLRTSRNGHHISFLPWDRQDVIPARSMVLVAVHQQHPRLPSWHLLPEMIWTSTSHSSRSPLERSPLISPETVATSSQVLDLSQSRRDLFALSLAQRL